MYFCAQHRWVYLHGFWFLFKVVVFKMRNGRVTFPAAFFSGKSSAEIIPSVICLMTIQCSKWHLYFGWEKKRVCPTREKTCLLKIKSYWIRHVQMCGWLCLLPQYLTLNVAYIRFLSLSQTLASPKCGLWIQVTWFALNP